MPILNRAIELLPVPLTPEELEARGQELAQLCQEINTAEDAKKADAAAHKAIIDALEIRRSDIARQVRNKSQDRGVEVEDILVIDDGMVRSARVDSGEVLRQRAATTEEINSARPSLFDPENTPIGMDPGADAVGPENEQ